MIVWFFACSKVSGVPTSRKGSAFPRSLARESANVVLLGNDLERFAETLALARKTRGIMGQNFVGTIGFLNPLLAAGIHVVSELVFIVNSARLLPAPEKRLTAPPERMKA
jgi:Cd2+/Zn2+-exporting ATPase/Cu+-exporting ATPase